MTLPDIPPANPPRRLLLGPGPSQTDPRVLAALSLPPLGHLDPRLLELMAQEQELLRFVFRTRNEWTFALSGTGTSAMEAVLVNLIAPGDAVLCAVAGYFGERLAEIAARCGAQVDRIERPWGQVFPVEQIAEALGRKKYKLLTLVHAETSTGALQPEVAAIARAAHEQGTLLVLDTVTSLGGVDVRIDEWDVDAAYSASQKCLSAPSGLAPVTIGPRARQAIESRGRPASFYHDLALLARYWGEPHAYHHTASATLHYALHTALRLAALEGLEERFARHRANGERLWAGLEALGLPPLVPVEIRLPVLTTPRLPAGLDEAALRARLLNEFNIEIAGGFGPLKGQVWRIGLMGYSSQAENVDRLLEALRALLT